MQNNESNDGSNNTRYIMSHGNKKHTFYNFHLNFNRTVYLKDYYKKRPK